MTRPTMGVTTQASGGRRPVLSLPLSSLAPGSSGASGASDTSDTLGGARGMGGVPPTEAAGAAKESSRDARCLRPVERRQGIEADPVDDSVVALEIGRASCRERV